MGMDTRNDLSVKNSKYRSYEQPVNDLAQKTSGSDTGNNTSKLKGANNVSNITEQQKVPSVYEENQSKIILEQEMDKLLKQIMPDLGIKFRIHDSGQIITTVLNNDTKEVIREFPAEKILDIVYSMCQKLGIVKNKKV